MKSNSQIRKVYPFKPNMNYENGLLFFLFSAYSILEGKGHTNWGVAATATELARAVLCNQLSIHPVSVHVKVEHCILILSLLVQHARTVD
jgi:hypothetical protein